MKNGKDTPLNRLSGTIPQMGSAMDGWFHPLTFGVVTKETKGFQVVETVVTVSFRGVIQPLSARQLLLKPEGQRAWSWFWVHADPSLNLEVDSVILYNDTQYRVMAKKDYSLYDFVEYELVQDWTGAGPEEAS